VNSRSFKNHDELLTPRPIGSHCGSSYLYWETAGSYSLIDASEVKCQFHVVFKKDLTVSLGRISKVLINDRSQTYYQHPMNPHARALSSTFSLLFISLSFLFSAYGVPGQTAISTKADLGSRTAKNGFRNEDGIKAKFGNWSADNDARAWLSAMGFKLNEIQTLVVSKPHDKKADIEVTVKTGTGSRRDGISIKLVSNTNGFNQIDKRWLSHYSAMWKMPADMQQALKLFVGETPPAGKGRSAQRMFIDELDLAEQNAVISFFKTHKTEIVSDLLQGDGPDAAAWVVVAFRSNTNTRWTLRRVADVIKFYSDGPVVITSGGNLKIGRITMQRKGGDAGRDTAKMLQFKINPALLFTGGL